MEKDEYMKHWNYFCSLAKRLDETKNYVFHGLVENNSGELRLVHGDVYSDCFQQIIILAASEFEVMSKELCKCFGRTTKNIVDISNVILSEYPKIVDTKVMTIFWESKPLENWKVDSNGKVIGIDWWDSYNALKHNEIGSYKMATLENAVSALAALYIINLYALYKFSGNLFVAYEYPSVYFRSKYTAKDRKSVV